MAANGPLEDLSTVWILLCSFLILSMQLGFAMLEVGSVREAHRMTVLAKNIMDSVVSTVGFWIYCQCWSTSLVSDESGMVQYHLLIFHSTFCATSVTITSGSMAERAHMVAYLCHAVIMSGVIYPVIATSAWESADSLWSSEFHERFHSGYHYLDFAGSGVVHFTGGCAALVGNKLLGRRIMRSCTPTFPQIGHLEMRDLEELSLQDNVKRPVGGWQRRFDDPEADAREFRGVAYLQVMGMFVLWVGWYAFNAGSTLSMQNNDGVLAGMVAWNTTMAAAGGCFGAYLFCIFFLTHLDVSILANGTLSGLVGITASCNIMTSKQSLLVGLAAGLIVFPCSSRALRRLHMDDPVDAIAVHCGSGLWGLLSVAFSVPDCGFIVPLFGEHRKDMVRICNDDFSMTKQLVAQAWGALTIFWWTTTITAILWGFFALSECTRAKEAQHLEKATELIGLMATPQPVVNETLAMFRRICDLSPIARRILKDHGWTDTGFQQSMPKDLWHLRHELQLALGERVDTALELSVCLEPLAKRLHMCRVFREIAKLRLRIPPAAELSGLGAANADGGQIAQAVRKTMLLLIDMKHSQSVHSPLRREVRELSLAMQSHEVLLQALTSSSRFRAGISQWRARRRALQSVPEHTPDQNTEDADTGIEVGAHALPATIQPPTWQLSPGTREIPSDQASTSTSQRGLIESQMPSPEELGRMLLRSLPPSFPRSPRSFSTDRTVSEHSAGVLSPHSYVDGETPPPSIIGQAAIPRSRGRVGSSGRAGSSTTSSRQQSEHSAAELAGQLMNLLQAQQQLWTTLQGTTPSATSGSRTPDSHHQQQQLQQAMRRLSMSPSNSRAAPPVAPSVTV